MHSWAAEDANNTPLADASSQDNRHAFSTHIESSTDDLSTDISHGVTYAAFIVRWRYRRATWFDVTSTQSF